jgi:hypothetical protein
MGEEFSKVLLGDRFPEGASANFQHRQLSKTAFLLLFISSIQNLSISQFFAHGDDV